MAKEEDMDKNEEAHTYEAYDKSKTFMRTWVAKALLESQHAYKGYYPVRTSWNKAVGAWNDFIDHYCMVINQIEKDEDAGPLIEVFEQECADFLRKESEVINKLRYLRKEDKKDAKKKAEATVLCQAGLRMASERLCMPPPGHAGGGQPEAAVQCQGSLCLPPGGDAGKEGSPRLPKVAVLCQGELLCTPEAAEAAVLCQGGRMVASESCLQASGSLCMPPPGHAGGGQPEAAVHGQGALCLPPGGDAGKEGSPRLPKATVLCQGELLCTPEAAKATVLCQAGLRMASERLCMPPPGHAGGGQPEAAVQGQGVLCLPPGGDAGKEGSPQLPKAAVLGQGELLCTPEAAEAAVLCQGGRMVASESCLQASGRLCMQPPGHAGGGQPEAAVQGKGALCLPPGGDAGKEASPRLQKAAVLCQGERLCTAKAAEATVLCQAGLRMASERLCMGQVSDELVPRLSWGRGPTVWRMSWLLEPSKRMTSTPRPSLHAMQTAFLKAKEEVNNNDRNFFVYNMMHFTRNPSTFTTRKRESITTTKCVLTSPERPEKEGCHRWTPHIVVSTSTRDKGLFTFQPSAGTVKGCKNKVLLHQSQNFVYNHKAKPLKAKDEDMGNKEAHTPEVAVLCHIYKVFKGQTGNGSTLRRAKSLFTIQHSAVTVKGFKSQLLLHQSQNLVYNHKAKPSKAKEEDMDNKEAHTPEAAEVAVLCRVYKVFKGQTGNRSTATRAKGLFTFQPSAGTVKGFKNQVLLHQSQNFVYIHKTKPSKAKEEDMDNNGNEEAFTRAKSLFTFQPSAGMVKGFKNQVLLGQGGRCLPTGGDAGKVGSPQLPKVAFLCQGKLLCTPEAAVLCQGGRMVASESCLQASGRLWMPHPGHAGGGQPKAAVQGWGRLCLPPGVDAGKEGSPRLTKAAFLSQGGLLCTPEAAEAAVL
jgi:hypothetical protein